MVVEDVDNDEKLPIGDMDGLILLVGSVREKQLVKFRGFERERFWSLGPAKQRRALLHYKSKETLSAALKPFLHIVDYIYLAMRRDRE